MLENFREAANDNRPYRPGDEVIVVDADLRELFATTATIVDIGFQGDRQGFILQSEKTGPEKVWVRPDAIQPKNPIPS